MNTVPTPLINDGELIAQFESGAIPPDSFHHADHVRLAFAYLSQYSILEALEKFPAALRQFAKQHAKPNLYHQTITWAYLFLIHERLSRAGSPQNWDEFANANPDLLTWKNGILMKYYADETLQSDLARRVFIFPDKLSAPTVSPFAKPPVILSEVAALQRKAATQSKDPASARTKTVAAGNSHDPAETPRSESKQIPPSSTTHAGTILIFALI
jgi:hypothetical protein